MLTKNLFEWIAFKIYVSKFFLSILLWLAAAAIQKQNYKNQLIYLKKWTIIYDLT